MSIASILEKKKKKINGYSRNGSRNGVYTMLPDVRDRVLLLFRHSQEVLWNEEEGKEEVSLAFRGNTTPLFCNIDSTTFSVTNETDLVSCCDIQAGVSDILGLADA